MNSPDRPILRDDVPEQIDGDRIILRAIRTGDGAAISECIESSREHLAPWSPWLIRNSGVEDSEDYARRSHAGWIGREGFRYGIWDKASGEMLGQSSLLRPDWSVPSIEIGYWIRASAHGKGYVTEAVRRLVRVAFEDMGMQRVHIRCDAPNRRSAAVAERAGFTLEATLRNYNRNADGELTDAVIYGMTPADYERVKSRQSAG